MCFCSTLEGAQKPEAREDIMKTHKLVTVVLTALIVACSANAQLGNTNLPIYAKLGYSSNVTAYGNTFVASVLSVTTSGMPTGMSSNYTTSGNTVDFSSTIYGVGSNTDLYRYALVATGLMSYFSIYNNGTVAGVSDNTSHNYTFTVYGTSLYPYSYPGQTLTDIVINSYGGTYNGIPQTIGTLDWSDCPTITGEVPSCAQTFSFDTDSQQFGFAFQLSPSAAAHSGYGPVVHVGGYSLVRNH